MRTVNSDLQYTIRMHNGCGHEFLPGVYCTQDANHEQGQHGVPVGEQMIYCPHGEDMRKGVAQCSECFRNMMAEDYITAVGQGLRFVVGGTFASVLIYWLSSRGTI